MDRSAGEVAYASGMVEVEMGRHDVAHVVGAEAQIRDLPQRRLGDREPRPRHRIEQESEPASRR